MSAARGLATRLLSTLVRISSGADQAWALAMLRELDFIENDQAALSWALGSVAAIVRLSVSKQGLRLAKEAVGMVWGGAIAGSLVIAAFALLWLSFYFFPAFAERTPWLPWLVMVALPIGSLVVAAAATWRERRSLAIGILLSVLVLGTHAAIHLATGAGN